MMTAELSWGRSPRRAVLRNAVARPVVASHPVAPATIALAGEASAPYRIWLALAVLVVLIGAVHRGGAALLSGQPKPAPVVLPAKVPPIRIELARPLPQAVKPLPQAAKPTPQAAKPQQQAAKPAAPRPPELPQAQAAKVTAVAPQARPVAAPNTSAVAPAVDAVSREAVPAPAPTSETVSEANGSTAYLHNPAPDYPPMAMNQGWEGKVLLRVFVLANGSAERIEIKQSSGRKMLDDAAIKAVKRWVFVPSKRGSTPLDGWAVVPIEFKLAN